MLFSLFSSLPLPLFLSSFPRQGQPVYPITTGGFRHPYPTALTVNASMSRWVEPWDGRLAENASVSKPLQTSPLRRDSSRLSVQKDGPMRSATYSNINYCYHFIMRPLKNVYPDWMAENKRTVNLATVTCRSKESLRKMLQISGAVVGLWVRALCGLLGSGSSGNLDANVPKRAIMVVCVGGLWDMCVSVCLF